jgi:hypothetical protein
MYVPDLLLQARTVPANLGKQYTERTHLERKEVDDVLGGADSWANVDNIAGMWSPFSSTCLSLYSS